MKVKYYVSLGFVGADRETIVNIPNEEVAGRSEAELEDYLWNRVDEWAEEQVETGYEILEK